MTLFLTPRPGLAQTVVLESYARARAPEAGRLMPIVIEELSRRGFMAAPRDVSAAIVENVSRPSADSAAALKEASALTEAGQADWLEGRFDQAVAKLHQAAATFRAASGSVAQTPSLRHELFECSIYLALANDRLGNVEDAHDQMAELIRGFPDRELSHKQHGPEAAKLFETVKAELTSEGLGSLAVELSDPAVVVFVNERYTGSGSVTLPELAPGPYRVYLEKGDQRGRVRTVFVGPGSEASLRPDWTLDTSLRTTPEFAGFEFSSESERRARETQQVSLVARSLGVQQVVVLGVRPHQGRRSVIGTVLALDSAKPLRSAAIAISNDRLMESKLRSLGRFLAGGDAGPEVEIVGGAAVVPVPEPPSGPNGWQIGTMAAGGAMAVGGVGLILLHQPRGRGRTYRATRTPGIIVGAAGGAAALAGLVWWLVEPDDDVAVFGQPSGEGAVAGLIGRF